jgi:hypothetical protein
MLFWLGLLLVLIVFVSAVAWGLRGMSEREHRPGTQRMR